MKPQNTASQPDIDRKHLSKEYNQAKNYSSRNEKQQSQQLLNMTSPEMTSRDWQPVSCLCHPTESGHDQNCGDTSLRLKAQKVNLSPFSKQKHSVEESPYMNRIIRDSPNPNASNAAAELNMLVKSQAVMKHTTEQAYSRDSTGRQFTQKSNFKLNQDDNQRTVQDDNSSLLRDSSNLCQQIILIESQQNSSTLLKENKQVDIHRVRLKISSQAEEQTQSSPGSNSITVIQNEIADQHTSNGQSTLPDTSLTQLELAHPRPNNSIAVTNSKKVTETKQNRNPKDEIVIKTGKQHVQVTRNFTKMNTQQCEKHDILADDKSKMQSLRTPIYQRCNKHSLHAHQILPCCAYSQTGNMDIPIERKSSCSPQSCLEDGPQEKLSQKTQDAAGWQNVVEEQSPTVFSEYDGAYQNSYQGQQQCDLQIQQILQEVKLQQKTQLFPKPTKKVLSLKKMLAGLQDIPALNEKTPQPTMMNVKARNYKNMVKARAKFSEFDKIKLTQGHGNYSSLNEGDQAFPQSSLKVSQAPQTLNIKQKPKNHQLAVLQQQDEVFGGLGEITEVQNSGLTTKNNCTLAYNSRQGSEASPQRRRTRFPNNADLAHYDTPSNYIQDATACRNQNLIKRMATSSSVSASLKQPASTEYRIHSSEVKDSRECTCQAGCAAINKIQSRDCRQKQLQGSAERESRNRAQNQSVCVETRGSCLMAQSITIRSPQSRSINPRVVGANSQRGQDEKQSNSSSVQVIELELPSLKVDVSKVSPQRVMVLSRDLDQTHARAFDDRQKANNSSVLKLIGTKIDPQVEVSIDGSETDVQDEAEILRGLVSTMRNSSNFAKKQPNIHKKSVLHSQNDSQMANSISKGSFHVIDPSEDTIEADFLRSTQELSYQKQNKYVRKPPDLVKKLQEISMLSKERKSVKSGFLLQSGSAAIHDVQPLQQKMAYFDHLKQKDAELKAFHSQMLKLKELGIKQKHKSRKQQNQAQPRAKTQMAFKTPLVQTNISQNSNLTKEEDQQETTNQKESKMYQSQLQLQVSIKPASSIQQKKDIGGSTVKTVTKQYKLCTQETQTDNDKAGQDDVDSEDNEIDEVQSLQGSQALTQQYIPKSNKSPKHNPRQSLMVNGRLVNLDSTAIKKVSKQFKVGLQTT